MLISAKMRVYLLFMLFYFVQSNTEKGQEKKRMIGLDTVHKSIIDKDTVITNNLNNLQKKKRGGDVGQNHENNRNPDWSYSSIPKEIKNSVDEFKRNMSECLKEVQASDKRPIKRLSPNKESPVHGECLIACVLKRNGIIDNGKVHKGNLLSLVNKFYAKDEKLIKKLEKNLDRCIEATTRIKDDCMIAAHLNDCTNGIMENTKHKININY